MYRPNRWQVLVLATALAMLGIAVASKSWVLGEEHLRAGLYSQTWSGPSWGNDPRNAFRVVGYATMFLSAFTIITTFILFAQAWNEASFATMRLLVLGGAVAQILLAAIFVNREVADITTWPGQAYPLFLVGSLAALIGAGALERPAPPP